jgi:dCMP deaminase
MKDKNIIVKIMKQKMIDAYMKTAAIFAELSHAKRLHVGAIVVKDDRIISIGYNGMPAGWDNDCEDRVYDTGAGGWLDPEEFDAQYPYTEYNEDAEESYRYGLKTKPEVLHAETNAIAKLARSSESGIGADLFVTHSPCLDCAKLIYQSGIKRVWFSEAYRNTDGVEFLKKSGVEVEQYNK